MGAINTRKMPSSWRFDQKAVHQAISSDVKRHEKKTALILTIDRFILPMSRGIHALRRTVLVLIDRIATRSDQFGWEIPQAI